MIDPRDDDEPIGCLALVLGAVAGVFAGYLWVAPLVVWLVWSR